MSVQTDISGIARTAVLRLLVLLLAFLLVGVAWWFGTDQSGETAEKSEAGISDNTETQPDTSLIESTRPPPQVNWPQHANMSLEDDSRTLDELVALADTALESGRVVEPLQDSAYQLYQIVLKRDPDNDDARRGVDTVLGWIHQQAQLALSEDRITDALSLIPYWSRLAPDDPDLSDVKQQIEDAKALESYLVDIEKALQTNTVNGVDGLVTLTRQLNQQFPERADVFRKTTEVQQYLIIEAVQAARNHLFVKAEQLLDQAQSLPVSTIAVADAKARVETLLTRRLKQVEAQLYDALLDYDFVSADREIAHMQALAPEHIMTEQALQLLVQWKLYGPYQPGEQFQDEMKRQERDGPIMVVIPKGAFYMGNSEYDTESPVHEVTFHTGFAIALTETTVDQFSSFVAATGYRTTAEQEGSSVVYVESKGRVARDRGVHWRHDIYGRTAEGSMPVVHVSFEDASAYTRWLGSETGFKYRLPSEAEFAFALRGTPGASSKYWWGEGQPDSVFENVTGDGDRSESQRSWNLAFTDYSDGFWGPAPVASFQANPFGVFDLGGNVSEWVLDCWHDNYRRAPQDGSAWVNSGCERRVIRGGAWSSTPELARSSWRASAKNAHYDIRVGFRVVRELIPGS